MNRQLAIALLLGAAACGNPNTPSPTVIIVTAPVVSVIPPTPPSGAPVATSLGPHTVLATIERTACYGTCPIYRVTIYADGKVEYFGEQFVKTKGDASAELSKAKLEELRHAFEAAHYSDFDDRYERYEMTDQPSVYTSYTVRGKTKNVRHYYGDTHAPKELSELEAVIDHIIDIDQFIGTREERDKIPSQMSH